MGEPARVGKRGTIVIPAKLRQAGVIRGDDLVVVVATAHALKFSGTMSAYHRGQGRLANPPRLLPATLDAILAALG